MVTPRVTNDRAALHRPEHPRPVHGCSDCEQVKAQQKPRTRGLA